MTNPYDGNNPYGGNNPYNQDPNAGDSGNDPFNDSSAPGAHSQQPNAGSSAFGSSSSGPTDFGVPVDGAGAASPNAEGFPSMPAYDPSADGAAPVVPDRPGAWIRFAALMIDNILLSIVITPLLMLASSPTEVAEFFAGESDEIPMAVVWMSLGSFILWFVYRAAMESSSKQASVGKMLTKQRVVTFEGGRLTFTQSLIRNSFYLIQAVLSLLPFLGIIYMIVYGVGISRNPFHQSHTDKWAKAYVIRA